MPQQPGPDPVEPPTRHLRYEISRLATVRNVALALIIAVGCIATVLAVGYGSSRPPRAGAATAGSSKHSAVPLTPPAASQPSGGAVQDKSSASRKLIPPTPEILAQLPADCSPVVHEIPLNLTGEARARYAQQIQDQACGQRSPWEQYSASGVRIFQTDAQGNLVEPCPSIQVERDKSWGHVVAFSFDGKHRYHVYSFKYACGHRADVTPDPYRDMMFADPAAIAAEYAACLCPDCQSMREYRERHGEPDGSSHDAAKQAGDG